MRVVGIDISKAEYCAAALVVDGQPNRVTAWKYDEKRDSEPVKLVAFEKWCLKVMWLYKPDVVAVEELAVFLNKKVIRTLSRREGIALVTAKKKANIVLHPPVTQSRSIVLGSPGNMSKDEAWKRIRVKFPEFYFGVANHGGTDKADALVHALAAPVILERR